MISILQDEKDHVSNYTVDHFMRQLSAEIPTNNKVAVRMKFVMQQ